MPTCAGTIIHLLQYWQENVTFLEITEDNGKQHICELRPTNIEMDYKLRDGSESFLFDKNDSTILYLEGNQPAIKMNLTHAYNIYRIDIQMFYWKRKPDEGIDIVQNCLNSKDTYKFCKQSFNNKTIMWVLFDSCKNYLWMTPFATR